MTEAARGENMKQKVLVVDDEKMIRNLLRKALTREGYEVSCAENAEDALKILGKETIYVMFLDLKLPGMNGVELCREIRETYPVSVIYAITGYASDFEISDCRGAGFEDYFTKPVDLHTIFKAAANAFEKINRWEQN